MIKKKNNLNSEKLLIWVVLKTLRISQWWIDAYIKQIPQLLKVKKKNQHSNSITNFQYFTDLAKF